VFDYLELLNTLLWIATILAGLLGIITKESIEVFS
jgi:hypothetical protein